ncbi:calpain 7 [Gonapodya sp. JEL0774]|nr:calpain 7 [Gonapodya sp. JEL0774]
MAKCCVSRHLEETSLEDLADELPENTPRYIILSYKLTHKEGRVSYPLVFIYYNPDIPRMASVEDLTAFYEDARTLASKAVTVDGSGADPAVALTFYKEAIEAFIRVRKVENDETKRRAVDDACRKYMQRAEVLKQSLPQPSAVWNQPVLLTEVDSLLQQGDFFLQQARVEDENNHVKDAIDQYKMAIETYLKAWRVESNASLKEKLRETIEKTLTRSEELKKVSPPKANGLSATQRPLSASMMLTDEEKTILASSSTINDHLFLPWNDDKDLNERFSSYEPFVDPDGYLRLSEKQKSKLGGWKRPSEIMTNPQMIQVISANNLVQLITATIWPQNSRQEPMYNPSGKYLIKLHYNGCQRRVGSLMCTYSRNRNEIWASIVEKAYMKLMGGYDFPGSNSGIDLHGKNVRTYSPGDLKEEEAETLGLVPTHAYAVLDVKNPWSHKRWVAPRGEDIIWSPELRRALNYDQLAALQRDDGIFWIKYSSMLKYFDSIHMNWNPELFRVRDVRHITWPLDDGPRKDNYNLGNNPQFGLETNVSNEKTAVWLLLTKHITLKEENKDYIALHVYENTNCDRVYYPENPFIQGVYINR